MVRWPRAAVPLRQRVVDWGIIIEIFSVRYTRVGGIFNIVKRMVPRIRLRQQWWRGRCGWRGGMGGNPRAGFDFPNDIDLRCLRRPRGRYLGWCLEIHIDMSILSEDSLDVTTKARCLLRSRTALAQPGMLLHCRNATTHTPLMLLAGHVKPSLERFSKRVNCRRFGFLLRSWDKLTSTGRARKLSAGYYDHMQDSCRELGEFAGKNELGI
ncbi:hypothetical protein BJX70DRAFT_374156 [Aspergillus crustosus]